MNNKVGGPLKVNLRQSKSSWSIKTKFARAAWAPFGYFLSVSRLRALSPVRVALLRLFGAQIGRKVLVSGGVRIWCPWNLEIASYTAIGYGVEIYNFARVSIGEHTVVSQYTYLCTASHHYQLENMPLYWKPITIGPQSWIAADAFLGPGVNIGEGAVVGARSVVTSSVDPWTVVAGNPARFIKERHLTSNGDAE